jgi:hypothetical protein
MSHMVGMRDSQGKTHFTLINFSMVQIKTRACRPYLGQSTLLQLHPKLSGFVQSTMKRQGKPQGRHTQLSALELNQTYKPTYST